MRSKLASLGFIIGCPLLTPFIHAFFGTFEKTGVVGILLEMGEASAVSIGVTLAVFRLSRLSRRSAFAGSVLLAFVLLELLVFLPKVFHMTPQDRMWLPVALIFYPLFVSPTVIGVCAGVAILLSSETAKRPPIH